VDAALKTSIWQQFGASIDMLENAIAACPESLWGDRSQNPEFWYVAFHTLFFLPSRLRLTNWTNAGFSRTACTRKRNC
jgi:hypothetical protein